MVFGGAISACFYLLRVSLRRLFWSRQTMICLLLLCFAAVAITAWSTRRPRTAEDFVEHIFSTIYVTFLLPMLCLSFGTAGTASDVENRTLVYLLVTPLPRPLIFTAKWGASLLMSLAWTMGSLVLLCRLGRKPGWEAAAGFVARSFLFDVRLRRIVSVNQCVVPPGDDWRWRTQYSWKRWSGTCRESSNG